MLAKWVRDSKILGIFEGTQQIQLSIIACLLLGRRSTELGWRETENRWRSTALRTRS